jgi:hypothetical protein
MSLDAATEMGYLFVAELVINGPRRCAARQR